MFLKKRSALLALMVMLNGWVGSVLADDQTSASLTIRVKRIATNCKLLLNNESNAVSVSGDLESKTVHLKVDCPAKTLATVSVSDDNHLGKSTVGAEKKVPIIQSAFKSSNIPADDNNISTDSYAKDRANFTITYP
ncbi:hypothetical protein [Candidatus Regiella insecticola]|uniref:hypothetical protein n=1 Tax=Candidatus Regiella insecticola TaxID=138073 RepID=UPI000586A7E3|nr:hypothetical protein [Candidatus Regiella insecticola]